MMPSNQYDLYFLVGSEFRPKRLLGESGYENYLIKYNAHDGLHEEIKNFDDLIVGKFEDNYENLPVKTFLGVFLIETFYRRGVHCLGTLNKESPNICLDFNFFRL